MNAPMTRNACPTLARPMQTGDGLLARLNPVAAGIATAAMIGLAEAALRHGNGIVEVTQRGSFQIRGLTEASAARLACEVDALGIAVRTGVPVETGPLAGLDPAEIADPSPLAEMIRTAVAQACLETRLGPKVSILVDAGGRFGLENMLADVRLKAVGTDAGPLWQLSFAGDQASARPIGLFEDAAACAAVLAVLRAIADLGPTGRARDLADGNGWHSTLPRSVPLTSPPLSFASTALTDSRFALPLGLPFGSIHARDLIRFLRSAEEICEIRLAPERRLLLLIPSKAAAAQTRRRAAESGFITDPSDSRLNIVACPGAPACGSGEIETRGIARALIADHAGWMPTLHISGCAKRCAAPRHKGLTLLGNSGNISLVLEAAAAGPPPDPPRN